MTCQRCKSERVANIMGKSDDRSSISIPSQEYDHEGYLPRIQDLCGGDYIRFDMCLDCGQVQGTFPAKVKDE